MRRLLLLLVACALCLLPVDTTAGEPAEWTILVYMTADTDLEAHGVGDLAEMCRARQSPKVRVVVQCDRAENDEEEEGYTGIEVGKLGNFDGTKRLLIGAGDVTAVQDLGEANMGDPKTLAAFIGWGIKAYPARHTAIVFWDHGAGWPGYGGDDSHDHDMLDLHEVAQGLGVGLEAGGLAKFDWIGFDCCLMSSLEVMQAVQPYGAVLVSSEELEPGEGWHYETWLSKLADHPALESDALGEVIADSYKAFFDQNQDADVRESGANITLSVVDLGKVPVLTEAVTELGAVLGDMMEATGSDWLKIAESLHDAEQYSDTGHHDLVDFVELLAHHGVPDKTCEKVRDAVRLCVLHHVGSKGHPRSYGVSIYFPRTLAGEESGNPLDQYRPFAAAPGWLDALTAFHSLAAQDESVPAIGDLQTSAGEVGAGEHADITAQIVVDDIADAWFVLAEKDDDGTQTLIGMIPTPVQEHLDADFDGNWLAIGDAEHQLVAPITAFEEVDEAGEAYIVQVPALYRTPKSGRQQMVTLYFWVDFDEQDNFVGEFIYAFKDTDYGPSEVELEAGGKILPVYTVVTPDGEMQMRPVVDEEALTLDEDGLDLVEEDLPPATYSVGFVVQDYAGNTGEALTEVTIEE